MKSIVTLTPFRNFLVSDGYILSTRAITAIVKKDYVATGRDEPYVIKIKYASEKDWMELSSASHEERDRNYKAILEAFAEL